MTSSIISSEKSATKECVKQKNQAGKKKKKRQKQDWLT